MSHNRDPGQIQLACERTTGLAVHARQFIHYEFQVPWPHGHSKSQALLIALPSTLSEMAAKNRFQQPSIRELDRRRLVGVIHGGNRVTTTGEILKQECVIGERTGIPMREDDYRMGTTRDGSVLATVCLNFGQREL